MPVAIPISGENQADQGSSCGFYLVEADRFRGRVRLVDRTGAEDDARYPCRTVDAGIGSIPGRADRAVPPDGTDSRREEIARAFTRQNGELRLVG